MGWTNSLLKKSRADLVLPGRPLFCISASLSSQRCFFYLSLYLVQSEGCTKDNAVRNSPWRILFRAFRKPSRTRLRGNSPLLSGRDHSQNWTQTENPRWFSENNHITQIQRVSPFFTFFWHQICFNLKSMSGTRADLHKNGHKRFRNVFQKWDFQSGSDVNKTRKVSSRFLPRPEKFSAQKRRMAFFGKMTEKWDPKSIWMPLLRFFLDFFV